MKTDIQAVQDKNRIIYLSGSFDEKQAKEVIDKLLKFQVENSEKDVILLIDSYGGSVDSFIAIHDTIKYICTFDVLTICVGKAMSAGQLLLMSGTKGKRFSTPNSRILAHQVRSGHYGKLSDLKNDIEETERLQFMINKLFFKYSKVKKAQLVKVMEKDSYMTPEEALAYGIIDHIIEKPKDLYSQIDN